MLGEKEPLLFSSYAFGIRADSSGRTLFIPAGTSGSSRGVLVFLQERSLRPRRFAAALLERVSAESDGAVFWIRTPNAADPFTSSTVLPADLSGLLSGLLRMPGPGKVIHLETGSAFPALAEHPPTSLEIPLPSVGPAKATLLLDSERAGTLEVELASAAIDPSLRYFFGGPITAFSYPIFAPNTPPVRISRVFFDPNAPLDPKRTFAPASADTARASNFRTVTGGAITLAPIPPDGKYVLEFDPSIEQYYWTLAGPWRIGVEGESARLLCGLSGVEYVRLKPGSQMRFLPGQPAYAPAFPIGNSLTRFTSLAPGVSERVTASWIYLADATEGSHQAEPLDYYAQPDKSVLFSSQSGSFLTYLPLQAGVLPPDAAASFPMVPYPGISAGDFEPFHQFEIQVLSPERRERIAKIQPPGEVAAARWGDANTEGVTPQGLLLMLNGSNWTKLSIARTGRGESPVAIADVKAPLKSALLSNQLFLVISDPLQFLDAIGSISALVDLRDWSFDFAPSNWAEHGTVLIFKFYARALEDLVNDLGTWTSPETFNGNAAGTAQTRLRTYLRDAKSHAGDPDFQYFLEQVVVRSDWNGVLVLNCTVPLDALPPQLEGLAAGINPKEFYAHHLGFNITPVQQTAQGLTQSDTSAFGLIFYQDPGDLFDNGDAYQFKVLFLKVLFQNSDVVRFSSQIQLYVGKLFAEAASLQGSEHGNNIILDGSYQRHGDDASYLFLWQGSNRYEIASQVLSAVTITKAQFVTVLPKKEQDRTRTVISRFLLWGNLQFQKLNRFDILSFGPDEADSVSHLTFSSVAVRMEIPLDATGTQKPAFAFEAADGALDPALSIARPGSLYGHFPLTASGLAQGQPAAAQKGKILKPADLGYISVGSPLGEGSLGDMWFGLVYSLDLGGQGSLAQRADFSATIMAAWSPDPARANVAIGIKLPGSSGASPQLTIEGPLKLTMKRIEFAAAENGGPPYVLKFRNIALSMLSVSFPKAGQTNLFLFGNPDKGADRTSLGWYGAYKKNDTEAKKGLAWSRRLERAGRT